MKTITLQGAVTNITLKKVTEEQAKEFALHNFADLCAYIKAEVIRQLLLEKIPTYQDRLDTRNKARRLLWLRERRKK